ncbi:MAG: ABC transporter substrate-binding protein [Pseudodesulfovibrio sp.]
MRKACRVWGVVCWLFCAVLTGCQPGGKGNDVPDDWGAVEKTARGSLVRFYMDGSDARANAWFDGYAAEQLKQRYGITLVRVPIGSAVVVARLLAEKTNSQGGDIDLFCIHGGDFGKARQEGVLFGPMGGKLPNFVRYVDKRAAAYDFGQPVEGDEVPLGWMQLVFRYAPARVSDPPKTLLDLIEWAKTHPGRFTYPAPPDSTGSAFLRQLLCVLAGGPKARLSEWSESFYEKEAPKVWGALQQMRPSLWSGGTRYPADVAELDALFDAGQIDIALRYGPPYAPGNAGEGRSQSFVLAGGTIGNMHFMAIPRNASNKAGALVVANFLLSPEAQFSKFLPENWGDCPAIDMDALEKEDWKRFDSVDLGEGGVPPRVLREAGLPDIAPEYGRELNAGWVVNGR